MSISKHFILTLAKILFTIALAFVAFNLLSTDGAYWTRFKLYRMLLTKPLDEIRSDYAGLSCTKFSEAEKKAGAFEAFVTGYCKPKVSDYKDRTDFLCSVALNCSCPSGKSSSANCASSSISWQGCKDFDETKTAYCHQTASTVQPKAGHLAADWSCFPESTAIEIDGKNYSVTDKGGIIKGRRFDIWFDDCAAASKTTGIYKVKIPAAAILKTK